MATVAKQHLWDGTLEPQKTVWVTWNNIVHDRARFFYAVPRVGQNSFPQAIEVQLVRIETTQSSKWRARIKLHNPTAPANIPQQDVCFYSMYMVTVD
jgi:hypothetical protein